MCFFLLDYHKLISLRDEKEIQNMCRRMYNKYFKIAEYELNLPFYITLEVKVHFKTHMQKLSKSIFTSVKNEIQESMNADVIPRYKKTIKKI